MPSLRRLSASHRHKRIAAEQALLQVTSSWGREMPPANSRDRPAHRTTEHHRARGDSRLQVSLADDALCVSRPSFRSIMAAAQSCVYMASTLRLPA